MPINAMCSSKYCRIKELYLEVQKGYHEDVEVLEDVNNMAKELGLDEL